MIDQSIMSRREILIAATAVTSLAISSETDAATPDDDADQVAADKMNVLPKNPSLSLSVTLLDGKRVELKATQLVIDFGGARKLFVNLGGVMPLSSLPQKVVFPEQPST